MPPLQASKPPPKKKVDLEEALARMMTSHNTFMNETKATFQNQAQQLQNQSTQPQNQGAQLRNLKVQIGQMATLLTERQHESLPSNSKVNPRQEGNEHVKAVTLRNGRELAIPGQPPVIREVETEEVIQTNQNDKTEKEQPQEKKSVEEEIEAKDRPATTEPIAILYPQYLKKNKLDKQFTKFMEVFKKLHINIPFVDALEHMPSYVTFRKDIPSKKRNCRTSR